MANVNLEKLIVTNISYDLNTEDAKEFSLEVKNEMSLKVHTNEDSNRFLLEFVTSIVEPKNNYINISVRANAFFQANEKITAYDDIVKDQCFPIVFDELSKTIDQILEILGYPKLKLGATSTDEN